MTLVSPSSIHRVTAEGTGCLLVLAPPGLVESLRAVSTSRPTGERDYAEFMLGCVSSRTMSMWDLSSLTKDRTWAPCSGSVGS